MRYTLSETTYILGKFNTGNTVTISLYKLSDSSSVTLTSNVCAEISTTGVFKWATSNITTQPTSFAEYLYIMTNGTETKYGKIALGGGMWDEETANHGIAGTFGQKILTVIKYLSFK